MKNHNLYGIIIALIGVFLISPDTLLMIWGEMSAFQMVAWRGLLSGVTYLIIWFITRPKFITSDISVLFSKWGLIISGCYFINTTFFCVGIAIAPAPVVLFCIATAPVFAAILGQFILKEPSNKLTWIAISMVLIGISISIAGANTQKISFDINIIYGAICGLASAITIALSYVMVRQKKGLPFVLPMCSGVIFSGLFALVLTGFPNMMEGNILPIIITGLIIVPVPMYLLSYASRFTQATNVSLILLLESILGPLWIWLGTGDQPADLTIFGGFIVIISTGSYLLLSKQN